MHSLIIHLSTATARRPNVDLICRTLPGAQVVEAVRGADVLAAGETAPRPGDLFSPRYPFALGSGEVGCFLSHRACWARIVAEGWDHALVVEDDFAVDMEIWPDVQRLISDHATPQSYVRLPAKAREVPAAEVARAGAARLFLPRRIGLQTVAQVVGRDAAARLLEVTDCIDRPVDALLQMHWATGQPVHTILPNGVRELTGELGGSTIQKKGRASGQLAREMARALYRARIALHPQRAG